MTSWMLLFSPWRTSSSALFANCSGLDCALPGHRNLVVLSEETAEVTAEAVHRQNQASGPETTQGLFSMGVQGQTGELAVIQRHNAPIPASPGPTEADLTLLPIGSGGSTTHILYSCVPHHSQLPRSAPEVTPPHSCSSQTWRAADSGRAAARRHCKIPRYGPQGKR